MRFSQFTVTLAAAFAGTALALDPLGDVPADLQSYIGSVQDNTAVRAAVAALAAATPIQQLIEQVIGGNARSLSPEQFVQSLEAAAEAAVSAAPTDVQAVAKSVIGVVESLAATDNLAATLATEFSLTGTGAAATSGPTTPAATVNTNPAAPSTQNGAAPAPTGMALGAFVGAVAVVAAVL